MNEALRFDMVNAVVRGEVQAFFEDGIRPGLFVQNVLANDLYGAFGEAGPAQMGSMSSLVNWLRDFATAEDAQKAFGDWDKVDAWCAEADMDDAVEEVPEPEVEDVAEPEVEEEVAEVEDDAEEEELTEEEKEMLGMTG